MKTEIEIRTRIIKLREELEARHNSGIVKMASENGEPIPTQTLQDELYRLTYLLSKRV